MNGGCERRQWAVEDATAEELQLMRTVIGSIRDYQQAASGKSRRIKVDIISPCAALGHEGCASTAASPALAAADLSKSQDASMSEAQDASLAETEERSARGVHLQKRTSSFSRGMAHAVERASSFARERPSSWA